MPDGRSSSGGSRAKAAISSGRCSDSCMKNMPPTIDGAQNAQIRAAMMPAPVE
jgi:hypothetical protein